MRVLDERRRARSRAPGSSGISKEATSMALTSLAKSGYVVVDGTTAATKSARLTPDGRAAQAMAPGLHADLEKRWEARLGADTVRGCASLERLLGQREVFANGLEPYPDGWRASKPYARRRRPCSTTRSGGCPTTRWCSIAAAGRTAAEPLTTRHASVRPVRSRACGAPGSRRPRATAPDRRSWRRANASGRPGSGGRHQQIGAPPGCGQIACVDRPGDDVGRAAASRVVEVGRARRPAASRRRDAAAAGLDLREPPPSEPDPPLRPRRRRRPFPARGSSRERRRARPTRSPRRRPAARARGTRASAGSV